MCSFGLLGATVRKSFALELASPVRDLRAVCSSITDRFDRPVVIVIVGVAVVGSTRAVGNSI